MEELYKLLSGIFGIPLDKINEGLSKEDIDSWDSLKQMDLVVGIEEHYGIELEIEEIVALNSVKSIIEVLTAKNVL